MRNKPSDEDVDTEQCANLNIIIAKGPAVLAYQ